MKTIKSLKDITTLEVDDEVVFGDLKYIVTKGIYCGRYYLLLNEESCNSKIFKILNIDKVDFIQKLGINANTNVDFPEVKSLEALTAIVSALFKEYEKQNEFPKTWKEFCERNPIKMGECLMGSYSNIYITEAVGISRDADEDRNYYISKQEAEAFLALMQLRQLRKAYVKNWEPDWKGTKQYKACIMHSGTDFIIAYFNDLCSRPLSFPTEELAKQFLTNFKDLLEIAKPLL
jgi:hypothetical protein